MDQSIDHAPASRLSPGARVDDVPAPGARVQDARDQAQTLRALAGQYSQWQPPEIRLVLSSRTRAALSQLSLAAELGLALSELGTRVQLRTGSAGKCQPRGRLEVETSERVSVTHDLWAIAEQSASEPIQASFMEQCFPVLVLPAQAEEAEARELLLNVLEMPLAQADRGIGLIVLDSEPVEGLEKYRGFARAVSHPTRRLALRFLGSLPPRPAAVAAYAEGRFLLDYEDAARWAQGARLAAERLSRWISVQSK